MSFPSTSDALLFQPDEARVVVSAPAPGPGNWAGAASAFADDGLVYLAYRVRRPVEEGRGVSVVVARSSDGEVFEQVSEVHRDQFGAESFERPVVVRRPDGGWRLYLSCATPGSKHWWIEAVDADRPEEFATGHRTVVLAGSEDEAVKDPVVLVDESGWRMWLCSHPLGEPGQEDRMSTKYATSHDGLVWDVHGELLAPTTGTWDARGARVTAVLSEVPLTVLYDGRATAEENWHEVTGLARESGGRLEADSSAPIARSPYSDGALRYATVAAMPDGSTRVYYEMARPDGAHDLCTNLVPDGLIGQT
ncbi:MAG TPA: hypothetical protein VF165_03315 [Nocardioidaceae bacterium]